MSRTRGAWTVTIIAIVLATAASLSLGDWSSFTIAGMNLFSLLDNFTSIVMLPLLGILTAVFVGWIWKREDMRAELTAEGGVDKATYPVIRFLLRYICPVLVSVVFIFGIIDFVKSINADVEEPIAKVEQKPLRLNIKGVEGRDAKVDIQELSSAELTPIEITVVETDKN